MVLPEEHAGLCLSTFANSFLLLYSAKQDCTLDGNTGRERAIRPEQINASMAILALQAYLAYFGGENAG
jgi:hypothetical protein